MGELRMERHQEHARWWKITMKCLLSAAAVLAICGEVASDGRIMKQARRLGLSDIEKKDCSDRHVSHEQCKSDYLARKAALKAVKKNATQERNRAKRAAERMAGRTDAR